MHPVRAAFVNGGPVPTAIGNRPAVSAFGPAFLGRESVQTTAVLLVFTAPKGRKQQLRTKNSN
jgi:hypothetical protein